MSLNQVNSSGELERVAGGTLYADNPLGTILPFGSATIPTGWLLCDGTAISRTEYSELFAVIGTVFGSGDGSSTFNIPDLRGKVPVGFNTSETEFSALGNTGGEKTHKLTVSEMPSHSHKVSDSDSKKGIYDNFIDSSSGTYNRTTFQSCSAVSDPIDTTSTGGSTAHNNLQPYNTVNYIIKAKMTVVPADFLAKVEDVYGDIIPSDASASNKLVTQDSVSNVIQGIIPMSDSSSVIGDITFGVDADGNYGYYKVGADTVTPFKSGGGVSGFGTNTTSLLNLSSAGGSSTSTRIYYRYISANYEYPIGAVTLDKGKWIAFTWTTPSYDGNMILKDSTNNKIINPLSHTNISVSFVQGIHLYLYDITSDITINTLYFDKLMSFYTSSSTGECEINLIKLV